VPFQCKITVLVVVVLLKDSGGTVAPLVWIHPGRSDKTLKGFCRWLLVPQLGCFSHHTLP
jgi:hypothetical protein